MHLFIAAFHPFRRTALSLYATAVDVSTEGDNAKEAGGSTGVAIRQGWILVSFQSAADMPAIPGE
jgi:hypothetical protein